MTCFFTGVIITMIRGLNEVPSKTRVLSLEHIYYRPGGERLALVTRHERREFIMIFREPCHPQFPPRQDDNS
jgi:hypothetical protein